MTKEMKTVLIIIGIILVIFAIIFAVYQYFQEEPMNANTIGAANVLEDANTGLENMLNEILEEGNVQNTENATNDVENSQAGSGQSNTNSNSNASTNQDQNQEDLTEDDNRATPREEKAIELVKEEWIKNWGNTDGVSFSVSVQEDGKYGVTVYDASSTEYIILYVVDVDTGIVKEK